VYYLKFVLPFWKKLQIQITGKPSSSPFLWGDSEKKEHRQWTDRSRSSRSPGRAVTLPGNGRGMIKEKRVRTRTREVRRGHWPNGSAGRGRPNEPGRF